MKAVIIGASSRIDFEEMRRNEKTRHSKANVALLHVHGILLIEEVRGREMGSILHAKV